MINSDKAVVSAENSIEYIEEPPVDIGRGERAENHINQAGHKLGVVIKERGFGVDWLRGLNGGIGELVERYWVRLYLHIVKRRSTGVKEF